MAGGDHGSLYGGCTRKVDDLVGALGIGAGVSKSHESRICRTRADTLATLRAAVEVSRQIEQVQAGLVRRARKDGATWEQIARALGVSKQAVHKKYGRRRIVGAEP
ncbi:MAG TPA: hypothetical protein VK988_17485 [Acidimicrobiales bacterium]|nr:hypothetical protein [Acidimicrobiales bacterium]